MYDICNKYTNDSVINIYGNYSIIKIAESNL